MAQCSWSIIKSVLDVAEDYAAFDKARLDALMEMRDTYRREIIVPFMLGLGPRRLTYTPVPTP